MCARWRTTTCSISVRTAWRRPSTRWPEPGCGRRGRAGTRPRRGVDLLPGLSRQVTDEISGRVRAHRRPGDIAVISLHWGSNWGYDVGREQVAFAHRLIEGGVFYAPARRLAGASKTPPRPPCCASTTLPLFVPRTT